MIKLFSMEFWIGLQFFIDLIFVVLLFGFLRQLKKNADINHEIFNKNSYELRTKTKKTSGEIIDILEPLVHDARVAADSFDRQIKEKKNIIESLNDALDSRIISINLLLSRAESLFEQQQRQKFSSGGTYTEFDGKNNSFHHSHNDVFDEQREILELHARGQSIEKIASKLAMPEGEVNLVISLKEKFIRMENQE